MTVSWIVILIVCLLALPAIAYYVAKAAAKGWLQGHSSYYDTYEGKPDNGSKRKSE